jgi:hypothetical protein
MGDRPQAIVGEQAVVEADAFAEPFDSAIRRLGENSTARWTCQAGSLPKMPRPPRAGRAELKLFKKNLPTVSY